MVRAPGKAASRGFTLVEIMMSLAILGILASISIPNYRLYKDKAEVASMLTTLKYLMDGEDFYFVDHHTFYPESGNLSIQEGEAMEIPELAYNFPEGHKNRYQIRATNNKKGNQYVITVKCDFDSDGDGKDDRFTAMTDIRDGRVIVNREIVQLR